MGKRSECVDSEIARWKPLVYGLCRGEDEVSYGMVGLWKAILKYDNKGSFVNFARKYILGEVRRNIRHDKPQAQRLNGSLCSMSRKRLSSAIRDIVDNAELDLLERHVIESFLKGLCFYHIARDLQEKESLVKKIYKGAVIKLRDSAIYQGYRYAE